MYRPTCHSIGLKIMRTVIARAENPPSLPKEISLSRFVLLFTWILLWLKHIVLTINRDIKKLFPQNDMLLLHSFEVNHNFN